MATIDPRDRAWRLTQAGPFDKYEAIMRHVLIGNRPIPPEQSELIQVTLRCCATEALITEARMLQDATLEMLDQIALKAQGGQP